MDRKEEKQALVQCYLHGQYLASYNTSHAFWLTCSILLFFSRLSSVLYTTM